MIKLKEIIKEGKYWENRKFGESLPTLKLEGSVVVLLPRCLMCLMLQYRM